MPPRVRRRPLRERIKAYLDPLDFLLWLSEELETSDWEAWQQTWSIPLGIGLNLVMLVARANSRGRSSAYDDVFSDASAGAGFVGWLASLVVYSLSLLAFGNAVYTFVRKRHYRLFESAIDEQLSTPSAHRVKVQSSPVASSPLRALSRLLASDDTAASRAHPDAHKDVWEVAVWDPLPVCLQMFCFFSPGHVAIYWLFLPTTALDSRPSVTIFTTLLLAALLSAQLHVLQSCFAQQSKDMALIHREVLHEYDTKFVHPRTQRIMRDAGTQASARDPSRDSVDTFTPVTVVNAAGFRTRPNPNYASHVDPEGTHMHATPSRPLVSRVASMQSPQHDPGSSFPSPSDRRGPSLPASLDGRMALLQSPSDGRGPSTQTTLYRHEVTSPATALRHPQYRASTGGAGDGGNLGIYSHASSPLKRAGSSAASPLKKSASTTFQPADRRLQRVQGSPQRRQSGRI